MPSVIKFPGRILDRGGNNFAHFSNLNNVKVDNQSRARSSLISGRSGSTPQLGTLECDYFGFNLPVGAEITGIAVGIGHQKFDAVQGKSFSLGKPKIELENVGIPKFPSNATCDERDGNPPTYEITETRINFDGNYILYYPLSEIENNPNIVVDGWNSTRTARTYHGSYSLPSREQINSNQFRVIINYPKNVGVNGGYLELRHIYVRVYYKEPQYSLQLQKTDNAPIYVGEYADFKVTLNNINLVEYVTSVKITLPTGARVKYQGIGDSGGTVTIDGRVVTWTPPQSSQRASYNLLLSIKFAADGNITIPAEEQLTHAAVSLNALISPTPTGIVSEDIDSENIIYAKTDINFKLPIKIPVSLLENCSQIYLIPDKALEVKPSNGWVSVNANAAYSIPISSFNNEGYYELTCRTSIEGIMNIGISTTTTAEKNTFIVKVIDDDLTTPRISVIRLKDEELDRLGDGFTYKVNSQLKISGNVANISNFKDYYRNFRMGVVNSIPDTLDATAVFEACRNWSDGLESFNVFLDRTIEFSFDENYPVYIVFVGDYVDEQDYFSLVFTQPIIYESGTLDRYDTTTYLPEPILNLINDTANYFAELKLNSYQTSNPIRIYNFPFSEEFGTDKYHAIQGIELVCQMSCESQLSVFATLKSPSGRSGKRSAVLNPGENILSLGGQFDTWGFNIQELTTLPDWELELEIQNLFENRSDINVLFENIYVIAHFIDIKQNKYNVFVTDEKGNKENMRLHGMFVKSVDLNPGIKAKTQYVSVEGSDIHDPMSMNIDVKEIEIQFNVRGCTIEETTKLLSEITKIFTNDRDELNKPIHKTVEFDHLPGWHWDYILENTIDADVKNVGYESKIKLKIYDGTSWANSDIQSNAIGVNEGIAKVPPIIQLMQLTEDIVIEETTHNQKFTMTNPNFTRSDIILIDCADQKVTIENGESSTDISHLVDWDVDWFVLHPGEFRFEDNGTCIIQSVTYTPRGV